MRAKLELASIVRQHGEAFRRRYRLSRHQLRLMRAIEICRTPALGGHVDQCGQCGKRTPSYNSCRNRHCPKCGSVARARWLEQRKADLLPVEYFHVVFTVPSQLYGLIRCNDRLLYDAMFQASSQTLATIARDPAHLGAEIGFFGILHTWGQNLLYHPHIHYVVPGGGIGPDHDRWIACRSGFLLPVRVLSALFRNRMLDMLGQLRQAGKLKFPGSLEALAQPGQFGRLLGQLRKIDWVVYAKPPFGGAERVLDYLGRYTHRVAISNDRLLNWQDGQVSFRWKDYRRPGKKRTMELSAEEFLRRFLLHALPDRFQRIRYGGFLASRHRRAKLDLIRRLLGNPVQPLLPDREQTGQLRSLLTDPAKRLCPFCGIGELERVEELLPRRWRPQGADSS